MFVFTLSSFLCATCCLHGISFRLWWTSQDHRVAPLFCLLCAQHNGSIVLVCYVFLYVHFFTSSIPPSLLVLYFCLLHFLILCVNFFHCLSSSIWFFFDDLFLHFFGHLWIFFCTSASTTTLLIQHKLCFFAILWTSALPSTCFFCYFICVIVFFCLICFNVLCVWFVGHCVCQKKTPCILQPSISVWIPFGFLVFAHRFKVSY